MKTPRPTGTNPATTPPQLKIRSYTVTTKWVSITAPIFASLAKRMQRVPAFHLRGKHYCGELLMNALATPSFVRRLQAGWLAHEDMTEKARKETMPFTFDIEAEHLEEILKLSKSVDITPTEFIQAAVACNSEVWALYDAEKRSA